jgi:hypothetical protein
MKKIILSTIILSSTVSLFAQRPEDALKTGFYLPGGTARNLAIGGAMGSLGGDITAAYVNPAGIGMFKTNEFVFSPAFNLNWIKSDYRGTASKDNGSNNIGYGTTGFISGTTHRNEKFRSSAWSISINQTANYNNSTHYIGFNNKSTIADAFIDELVDNRVDTNRALSDYIYGSSLAYRTYLIDSRVIGNRLEYFRNPNPATGLVQEKNEETRGGINEINLAFASNLEDKLYLGGSVSVPIGYYRRYASFKEADATNDTTNDFRSVIFGDSVEATSIGITGKLGIIYKPAEKWRVGFAVHLPTWTTVNEKVWAGMTTNVEGYLNPRRPLTETSKALNSGNVGQRKYEMITPWKFILSGSYVFNEIEDTRKQKAFVTADIEYVTHSTTTFRKTDENDNYIDGYYNGLNGIVKNNFKGAFNFRLGGEIKFNIFMVRIGGAYYGNPYDDAVLKANRISGSFGLGYRNKGMFIDLTYVHSWNNDINRPYVLSSAPNTFAETQTQRGNIAATIGFKF